MLTTNNFQIQKRPWYLRKSWVYVMCIVFFPIGLINVLVHRNYWEDDERRRYIGIIIIIGFITIWGSLPASLSGPVIAIVFVGLLIIGVMEFVRK